MVRVKIKEEWIIPSRIGKKPVKVIRYVIKRCYYRGSVTKATIGR